MINLIKCYSQINKVTLKSVCERFCRAGGVEAESHVKQNNTMMSICPAKSLRAEAQARVLTYRSEYTFDGVEYAPLMYKVIMRLMTNISVATTQTLWYNLKNLCVFAETVRGNISKTNAQFDKNCSQLIARGATVDNPIGIIFEAYSTVLCYNFTKYIG